MGCPLRRANGASIAITTAPCVASAVPWPVMTRAFPGMPCMSTMPGRRPGRLTGSNNKPATDPPSGLLKEMALTSTPLLVDSTACCRFRGALTWAKRFLSAAVAAPAISGRATAQESRTALGFAGDPPHAEMNTTTSDIESFMKRQRTGSLAAQHRREDLVVQAAVVAADIGAATGGPDQTADKR